MTADKVKQLRERLGLSQAELAVLLNEPLQRAYRSSSVSAWETGKRPVPEDVGRMLDAFALEGSPGDNLGPQAMPEPSPLPGEDAPPSDPLGDGRVPAQAPLHAAGGAYARACTELWEMVGLAITMIGAATGNTTLQADGMIIDADKVALGRAYGKLAETNETFRTMLMSMTTGGAWLEVALVTGTTLGKVVRNHNVVNGSATAVAPDRADRLHAVDAHAPGEPAATA